MATWILRPGEDVSVELTNSSATGDNYTYVDEESTNDSDYILNKALSPDIQVDATDEYKLTNNLPTNITINSVTIYFRGSRTNSNIYLARVNAYIDIAGTSSYGTSRNFNTTTVSQFFERNTGAISRPGGGSWLYSDITNLKIGFDTSVTSSTGSGELRLSQIWVVIDYTEKDVYKGKFPTLASRNWPGPYTVTSSSLTNVGPTDDIFIHSGGLINVWAKFTAYTDTLDSTANFSLKIDNTYRPVLKRKFRLSNSIQHVILPFSIGPTSSDDFHNISLYASTDSGNLSISGVSLYGFSNINDLNETITSNTLSGVTALSINGADQNVISRTDSFANDVNHIGAILAGYSIRNASNTTVDYMIFGSYDATDWTSYSYQQAFYEEIVGLVSIKNGTMSSGSRNITASLGGAASTAESGINFYGFYFTDDYSSYVLPSYKKFRSDVFTFNNTKTLLVSGLVNINYDSQLLISFRNRGRQTNSNMANYNNSVIVEINDVEIDRINFVQEDNVSYVYDHVVLSVLSDVVTSGINTVKLYGINNQSSSSVQTTENILGILAIPYGSVVVTSGIYHDSSSNVFDQNILYNDITSNLFLLNTEQVDTSSDLITTVTTSCEISSDLITTVTTSCEVLSNVYKSTTASFTTDSYLEVTGGPWTPTQITTLVWLDANDSDTLSLSGSDVTQWNDKSGNSFHFTQDTAGQYPQYDATGFNSNPQIDFNGSSHCLKRTNSGEASYYYSAFFVVNVDVIGPLDQFLLDVQTGRFILSAYSNSIGPAIYDVNNGGAPNYGWWTQGVSTTGQQILEYFAGTESDIYRTGTIIASGMGSSAPYNFNDAIGLGARYSANTAYFNGKISEVVLVGEIVDTDTRQKLEGYLAHKWGIEGSLPSDHPYKSAAPTTGVTIVTTTASFETSSNILDTLSLNHEAVSDVFNLLTIEYNVSSDLYSSAESSFDTSSSLLNTTTITHNISSDTYYQNTSQHEISSNTLSSNLISFETSSNLLNNVEISSDISSNILLNSVVSLSTNSDLVDINLITTQVSSNLFKTNSLETNVSSNTLYNAVTEYESRTDIYSENSVSTSTSSNLFKTNNLETIANSDLWKTETLTNTISSYIISANAALHSSLSDLYNSFNLQSEISSNLVFTDLAYFETSTYIVTSPTVNFDTNSNLYNTVNINHDTLTSLAGNITLTTEISSNVFKLVNSEHNTNSRVVIVERLDYNTSYNLFKENALITVSISSDLITGGWPNMRPLMIV